MLALMNNQAKFERRGYYWARVYMQLVYKCVMQYDDLLADLVDSLCVSVSRLYDDLLASLVDGLCVCHCCMTICLWVLSTACV